MKFAKITNIMLWAIIGISIILVVSLMTNISPDKEDPSMGSWISTNLRWSYILFIFAFGAALVMEIVNTLSDRKATMGALKSIGFFGAIVLIAYIFADDAMPTFFGAQEFIDKGVVTPSIMKWIGTGLIATYILSAISLGAILWSSVSRILK